MLSLLVALSLSQAPVETAPRAADAPVEQAAPALTPPPAPPQAAVESEAPPNRLGRKAGFFSAPRVSGGTLVGRVGMGLLLGSIVGGTLATGFLAIGGVVGGLGGSIVPVIVTAPFAIASLGVGTALGTAMFGDDYGRDMGDAIGVALVCALISITAAVLVIFAFPTTIGVAIAVSAGLVFPAVATPLFVQVFKKEDAPQPTVALASF